MQVSTVQGARPDLWTDEGPTAATATPVHLLPPPPLLRPPPRDPVCQKAVSQRHLQPEPAEGGLEPVGDGQCPQGAAQEEIYLGLTASISTMRSGAVSAWIPKEAVSRSLQGSGCSFQALGNCCRAQHTAGEASPSAAAPAPVPSWTEERGSAQRVGVSIGPTGS